MEHPRRIPGFYVVRFQGDPRDPASLARELVDRHGGKVLATLAGIKGFWGELPNEAIDAILSDERVRYIEADVAESEELRSQGNRSLWMHSTFTLGAEVSDD